MASVWDDPNNVALLRSLWATRKSCEGIARKIGGITKDAVIGKAHRLGLPDRRTGVPREPYDRQQHKGGKQRRTVRA